MWSKSEIRFILYTGICCCLIMGFVRCSSDESQINISGYWTGENANPSTNTQWPFDLYLDIDGEDVFGVYSDYRGSITIRSPSYIGNKIGFVIDVHPDSVTFFGQVTSDNTMIGSWSYSRDENNGSWFLNRDKDSFEEDDDEDGEGNETSTSPFAKTAA